jgi:hypothetical protein
MFCVASASRKTPRFLVSSTWRWNIRRFLENIQTDQEGDPLRKTVLLKPIERISGRLQRGDINITIKGAS